MQRSVRRDMILLALGVLALCVPFLGKAYHMDDTLVVWAAQQIAENPSDFYGFDVNWYGYFAPMLRTYFNPPGVAYYAAFFGAFLGWSEWVMHASMALVAVALVLGVYWLARRLGGEPLLAAGLALVSPGILVSVGAVMTDLLMMALWVWAVALWLRGLDDQHPTANVVSALLIGLAALTKYFAVSLVPLLLVYTFLSGRKRWTRAVWLMIPFVLVGLFELSTWRLYGEAQFTELVGIAKEYHEKVTIDIGRKILIALAFLGAGGAPALFVAPRLWGRVGRIALCVGGAGAAAFTLILARSGWHVGEQPISYPWWFWPQYWLWILAGFHIVALALADAWNRRDRDAALLVFWLGGTLFFSVFVNHFVNIRVILPALPVVAILVARQWRARSEDAASASTRALWPALAAGLVLSLCVAHSDTRLANAGRDAAERLAPEKRAGRTWFSGHWGFQYYMEARGAKPIDLKHPDFRLGDTVVTPMNTTNRIPAQPQVASRNESFMIPVCSWLTTMRVECGAGFYSDVWGPLPFVFGPVPAELYEVFVLGR
jgi:4-amino-4-deoxy-L-arabinose transferase-like glycosyltransferase